MEKKTQKQTTQFMPACLVWGTIIEYLGLGMIWYLNDNMLWIKGVDIVNISLVRNLYISDSWKKTRRSVISAKLSGL